MKANKAGANPSALQELARQAQAQWRALGERERTALKLAAWGVTVLLLWWLAVQPALRTLREAPVKRDALELQLQRMQGLAQEARALRSAPVVPAAQAMQALQSASEHLGGAARLAINGERAVLTLNGVGSEALQAWLGEARAAGRARPVEAQLTRGPKGYTGSIVLTLSAVTP